MFGCGGCFYWGKTGDSLKPGVEAFSLPAPIPRWPPGQGFASGRVSLGEIEVLQITNLDYIWGLGFSNNRKKCNFYRPAGVPDGYFCLGHYCQTNEMILHGFLLVARVAQDAVISNRPALTKPMDYTLIWSSDEESVGRSYGHGYIWAPQPAEGFKALGFLVTNKPGKPSLEEVRCVRSDLTDPCEVHGLILDVRSKVCELSFSLWGMRPRHRGMNGRGVAVGTFFCTDFYFRTGEELNIACLKNLDADLHAMPNINQIHALVKHYGPTLYFHPDEFYFPSSVSWFFGKGALLYKNGDSMGEKIDKLGSNLPPGGKNDGEYWIDLPVDDERRNSIKCGNLTSAELYVNAKPALGGTFTDIAMWVFCPLNGPATLKVGIVNFALGKIGQHVGDWEHVTLRICNFTGQLWSVYFSQHSGGKWVDVTDLEFVEGNRFVVYSSKNGHASFPHPGNYIQGLSKLGFGIRNDAEHSNHRLDSSKQYKIVAAEYLGAAVEEPCWLQYMREWGPTVVYNSKSKANKIIDLMPLNFRETVANMFAKFPAELYGEEGPTGPKEKNNWVGDERW